MNHDVTDDPHDSFIHSLITLLLYYYYFKLCIWSLRKEKTRLLTPQDLIFTSSIYILL